MEVAYYGILDVYCGSHRGEGPWLRAVSMLKGTEGYEFQLTDVEACKADKNERSAHGAHGRDGLRNGKDAHGEIDLAEHNSGALPTNGPEL